MANLEREQEQMKQPIPTLQPLGQEISPVYGILDLSRIELRRLVATLQEQVTELQRELQESKRTIAAMEWNLSNK